MTPFAQQIEKAITALVSEPDFSDFAHEDAFILVWDNTGERLVWASTAAIPLREALTGGHDGRPVLPVTDAIRIKALAEGDAPRHGMKIEHLRLFPIPDAALLACLCRLISLPQIGTLLVVAIAGPAEQAEMPDDLKPNTPARTPPASFAERLRRGETTRFLWQANAQAQITNLSPNFAQTVGPQSAAIIGKTWPDVLTALPQASTQPILGYFERRETWSGETLFWPVDGAAEEVGIDFAGQAIYDGARKFIGYRGFGLIRGSSLRPRELPEAFDNAPIPAPEAPEPVTGLSTGNDLSESERLAFSEIALTLGDRISEEPAPEPSNASHPEAPAQSPTSRDTDCATNPLNALPVGVLVHREETILFANRPLLETIGFANLDQLAQFDVLDLFRDSPALTGDAADDPFLLTTATGDKLSVDVSISSVIWQNAPASLMLIRPAVKPAKVENIADSGRVHELEAILSTISDAVVMLDDAGCILSLNAPAKALFGYEEFEVAGAALTALLTPESHGAALEHLGSWRMSASARDKGCEVVGETRQGDTIALFMEIGTVISGGIRKFCVVLRDVTSFKRAEAELQSAKKAAEASSAQKSDLLAKISHEIRTPLNAIIGFAEMMIEERMGPIGNERYKSYLKDMHASGSHVMSLVNDLLDLAKIESGHVDMDFTKVQLNDLVTACVGMMNEQAARERIIMRTSFAETLPPVVADERSVRQIVLNLLSNAIKFTDAGGQVIVSTAMTEAHGVVIRVRDTGIGMNEDDIIAALEPFRQLATARQRGGTGLGLPLTKALIEANHGSFGIFSTRNEGTLVEVVFPPHRLAVE